MQGRRGRRGAPADRRPAIPPTAVEDGRDGLPRRLRRLAFAYAAAVAVVATAVGPFVHGESAFLVAWAYTGGAVALPAILVNWMVARREIGAMPGGAAWSAGLVWVYIDGLGLLHIAADPASPFRSLSVPAVLPPVACFAVAAARLAQHQEGEPVPPRRVFGTAAVAAAVVGAATVALLGDRLATGDALWLARPSALVAVAMTAGALASARFQHTVTDATRGLGRTGLALLALGAVNAWAVLAQALSDFSLPAAPLLALQATTMGLLLQVPLHAPRLPAPGGGPAGPGEPVGPRPPAVPDVVSRAWFAEDPTEAGVLPLRLRRPAIAYVAVTVPLLGALGLLVEGRVAFLVAWVYVSAVYTTPAMVVTWAASRRTQYQARPWRLWFLAVVALYLDGAALLLATLLPGAALEYLAVVAVLPCIGLFGAAAIAMMRARSGSRSLAVDVIETTMVTTVVCVAVLLVVGDELWRSDEAWFTVPTALVTIAVTSGLAWTLMMYTRMPHENRELEALGLALALAGTVDAWAMLAQGLSGFTLPAAPLLALQALTMGLLLLLPLYVPRDAPHGLERLPPHEQVRNSWALVAVTVGALPALYLLVRAVRDDQPWAPGLFVLVVSGLLFLSVARQALTVGETRHLYGQVTRAAEERRRLLAEVMRSMDNDRHRVAAHLHEQAVTSYAAFVSLNLEAERIGARHGGTLLAEASARLRATFGDQAESLRRLMLAMQPLEADGRRSLADRLRSPIEAYTAGLWGDAAAPELRVEVRDGLALDWTTEAIVLRVAQEAIGNVRRHAGARRVDVRLDVDGDDHLTLVVADDGHGFDPAAVLREGGIAVMRSSAALVDADLTVESRPGAGTTVRLAVRGAPPGPAPLPPPSRPDLRVIR